MFDLAANLTGLMPSILVGSVVGIVAHEAGHCAGAALVSIPIRKVRIGVGPPLLRARCGKAELELRAFPIGGLVQVEMSEKSTRPRVAVYTLGGAAANAALYGIAVWLWQSGLAPALPHEATAGFAIAQIALLATALIPARVRAYGVQLPTDGMQLVLLLCGRHGIDAYRSYDQLLALYAPGGTARMTDASRIVREQMARGALRADAGVRRDVVATLLRQLAKDGISREERRLILDMLVMIALSSRDPDFYGHLDAWSREAADLAGSAESNTRGLALVDLGEFAAGKAMLDAVAKPDFATRDPFDMSNRIITQAFIARAEGALGARKAGRWRLDRARRAIRANAAYEVLRPLVDRIDRELIAGRYTSPMASQVTSLDAPAPSAPVARG